MKKISKPLILALTAAMLASAASCQSAPAPAESAAPAVATAAGTSADTTTAAAETTTTTAAETTTTAAETTTTAAATTTTTTSETAPEPAPLPPDTETAEAPAPETEQEETTADTTTQDSLPETFYEPPAETAAPTETTAETTAAKTNIFDNIGVTTTLAPNEGINALGNKYVDIVFDTLPSTYEEFIALPQAQLSTVYDTAAMTVLALCFYPSDPELSMKMYEYVSGPRTINNAEYSFIKDRFMDYDYVPRSYFTGATPENDYKPSEPYTVRVSETPYTYDNEGYAKMYLTSGGSDNDRFVMLRKGKDGKWYLWEQFILVGIREPSSSSPWA